jgi:CBS domain-containing protein
MAITLAKSLRSDPLSRLPLRSPYAASPDTSVEDVVRQMSERRTSYALLEEGGRLVGIFTERDFVNRVVAAGREVSGPVRDVMTPDPKTLARNDNVQKAVELMCAGGYRHVPVMGDDGRAVGVLSVRDVPLPGRVLPGEGLQSSTHAGPNPTREGRGVRNCGI